MALVRSALTPLERAVISWICQQAGETGVALATQIATAKIIGHENNGHGFYAQIQVDRAKTAPLQDNPQMKLGPQAKIKDLQHGMGFILWFKEGYADCLEGYGYGEDIKDLALENAEFELFDSEPQPKK